MKGLTMRNHNVWKLLMVTAALGLAGTAQAQTVTAPPTSVKTEFDITSSWYTKYVDAGGIPVLGSSNVSDAALLKARSNVLKLLGTKPTSVTAKLRSQKVRVVIIGLSETVRNIPEYAAAFPSTANDASYWGGFGATPTLPITAGTQNNLINNYGSENVFVHEFGHTVAEMGLPTVDTKFQTELNAAYNYAKANGLWTNTYADDNIKEYWAEGIQSYFSVNREGVAGGDGVHNQNNTRSELQSYDAKLYSLLSRVYGSIVL